MDSLGRAILDQGRASEAEAVFRRALALAEEGGATAVSRGITMDMLGRAILDQGRASEAEAVLRRALALSEEGGGMAVSRGFTMHELGRAILDQGRASEAEAVFRRALELSEQGGATAVSRGITMHGLGRAILDQGRGTQTLMGAVMRELAGLGLDTEPERWWDDQQRGDILHYFNRPGMVNLQLAHQKGFKVVMTELLDQTSSRSRTQLFGQRMATRNHSSKSFVILNA